MLPLILPACDDASHAAAELQKSTAVVEEITGERDRFQTEVVSLTTRVAEIEQEFTAYKDRAALCDDHALFEAATKAMDAEQWTIAAESFERFLSHYPKSPMGRQASSQLKAVRQQIAELNQREADRATAAELASLSLAEIKADLSLYRGKSLERSMECSDIFGDSAPVTAFCFTPTISEGENVTVKITTKDLHLAVAKNLVDGTFSFRGLFRVTARGDFTLTLLEVFP